MKNIANELKQFHDTLYYMTVQFIELDFFFDW